MPAACTQLSSLRHVARSLAMAGLIERFLDGPVFGGDKDDGIAAEMVEKARLKATRDTGAVNLVPYPMLPARTSQPSLPLHARCASRLHPCLHAGLCTLSLRARRDGHGPD